MWLRMGVGRMRIDGQPRDMITTVLDGLRAEAPEDWEVTYSRGADIVRLEPDPEGDTWPDGQPRWPIAVPVEPDESMIAQAVADAQAADVVVAVVGDHIEVIGETRSTATLELLGGQVALLDALAATGKPLVIVLMASKPLVLPESTRGAAALLWAANPGMEGGTAIAEILLGTTEPTGRLPISFAVHVGQQPTYYNQIRGQHGRRYADLTQVPAYSFGYGLSYTTVEYSDAGVAESRLALDSMIRGHVTVTNTGERPTIETVQAYISDLVTSVSWTDKELKAYKQVTLAPGESARVEIEIPVSDCTIVDAREQRVVEPGKFHLLLGSSSRAEDLLIVPFEVA